MGNGQLLIQLDQRRLRDEIARAVARGLLKNPFKKPLNALNNLKEKLPIPDVIPDLPKLPDVIPDLPKIPKLPDVIPDLPKIPKLIPDLPKIPKLIPDLPVPDVIPKPGDIAGTLKNILILKIKKFLGITSRSIDDRAYSEGTTVIEYNDTRFLEKIYPLIDRLFEWMFYPLW